MYLDNLFFYELIFRVKLDLLNSKIILESILSLLLGHLHISRLQTLHFRCSILSMRGMC